MLMIIDVHVCIDTADKGEDAVDEDQMVSSTALQSPQEIVLEMLQYPELPEQNTFSDETAAETVLDANEDSPSSTSPFTMPPVVGDEHDKPQLLTYELKIDGPGAKESRMEVVPTTHSTGKIFSLLFTGHCIFCNLFCRIAQVLSGEEDMLHRRREGI